MLKILLVEDEVVIRESIRKNVNWGACGYTFVGEAADGELAYALIKEKKLDVVSTDIKTPFMDGLEFSRLIRNEMPAVKIIILTGHSNFAYAENTKRAPLHPDREVSLNTLDVNQIDKAMVERFLCSGTCSEAQTLVEELFRKIGQAHVESLLLRQYLAMDIHFAVGMFVDRLGIDKEQFWQRCGTIDHITSELSSVERTKQYLSRLLAESVALRDEASQRRYNALIRKAQGYIEENYNSDISLNKVAQYVNVSPTHFSALFRQETGTTFIEYLTSVRMEKARELLRCTAMKASEVAYETGYHDPHYFSYLFKKVNGCTPRDFRIRRKVERCGQKR